MATELPHRNVSLTPDELLATTRAVRRRLDLKRPVDRGVIEECLALARQAPTGGARERWHFVVVTEPEQRQALAALYHEGWEHYRRQPFAAPNQSFSDPAMAAVRRRVGASAQYLHDHLAEVPVHVIPCISPRPEGEEHWWEAALWGSILPAVWSFMLAARLRGLGTSWTTLHLYREQSAAALLGIPYEAVRQVALIPVAYTTQAQFKPAFRGPSAQVTHWNHW
jgi:nitroreductase